VLGVEMGYARVSTAKQDLDRQIDALNAAGIPVDRIYLDKKSGATADRPRLRSVLGYARDGDVIVVHTLDRLGRTVRDTLNLIHELAERGVGVRNLADPIKVDSSNPAMAPRGGAAGAVRADGTHLHPRAGHLRDTGHTIAEIVTTTGIPRTSLYRHLPPRPPEPVTAGGTAGAPDRDKDTTVAPPGDEDQP